MKNVTVTFFKNNEKGDNIYNGIFRLDHDDNGTITPSFNDVTIDNTYDENGNLVREKCTRPDGIITRDTLYKYNAKKELVEANFTDLDLIVNCEYDEKGNCINKYSNQGDHDINEYDEKGRIIRCTDVNGDVTKYEYDDENNIVRTLLPDGRIDESARDENGRWIYGKIDGELFFENKYFDGIKISTSQIAVNVDIDMDKHQWLFDLLKQIIS